MRCTCVSMNYFSSLLVASWNCVQARVFISLSMLAAASERGATGNVFGCFPGTGSHRFTNNFNPCAPVSPIVINGAVRYD